MNEMLSPLKKRKKKRPGWLVILGLQFYNGLISVFFVNVNICENWNSKKPRDFIVTLIRGNDLPFHPKGYQMVKDNNMT
jgi:hypothetical protein